MFPRSVETGNHNLTGSQTYSGFSQTHWEAGFNPSFLPPEVFRAWGSIDSLLLLLLPPEPRAVGTQSSSTHGRGHWTASLDILSSTRSSPSWDQPLRLGGRSPISQIHSHHDPGLMPQHWGTRAVASNLSPPVVTYLCRCSVPAAQSSSLGKIPKASGWSLVPSFAPPSSSSLCSCPLLLQPPRAAPPFLLPALPVLCLLSESQTRDWGGGGEDPRRGSASDGPAPNLGGCRGEGGAGRLLIV